jgi:hypothetical protein
MMPPPPSDGMMGPPPPGPPPPGMAMAQVLTPVTCLVGHSLTSAQQH